MFIALIVTLSLLFVSLPFVGLTDRIDKIILSLQSLWECLTAACKAFSLANGKGMGTNDWVIRSLDNWVDKREEAR
jgi:hypothetical protein